MKQALSLSEDGEGAVQEGDEMAVNADKIISIARAEIGTKATNIKKCKYNNWFYGTTVSGSGYDWCETFVQWVFHQAGASSLLYTKTANCGYAAKAFQDHGRLKMSGFKRGDVVFFHWTNERSTLVPGTYVSDHVGIIESVNGDNTITTIEGNTGSSSNGEVMRRVRSLATDPVPADLLMTAPTAPGISPRCITVSAAAVDGCRASRICRIMRALPVRRSPTWRSGSPRAR